MTYNRKVCIIGAGYTGSSIAYALTLKDLSHEIILIDVKKESSQAEVLDIRHGIPYMGAVNIHSGDYEDIKDSDLIIVTAGRNRRPGELRLDLAADNVKIAHEVTKSIKKHYNKGVIMVVSNPNDVITYKMNQWMDLPPGMVFGTGCILDESRLVNVIADYVNLNAEVINAQVIGEHGESQIAVWSKTTIAGIPIKEYCSAMNLEFDSTIRIEMENRVKTTGSNIIRGKGRTHYGIATCVCYIADAILNRRATISCVSSTLEGEYGINDVALSIPSVIGYNGVTKRLEDKISDFESERLDNSANMIKSIINAL